ncbi:MAG: PH domain-containing protein [Alphaproteobacteria bacterium]|nr:PH domain-containing protein [Alphaproteobacteria bacterium]
MAKLYLQDILLPQEKILYHAKVHYILYAPGVSLLVLAYLMMYYIPDIAASLNFSYSAWSAINSLTKFASISAFMAGIAMLLKAWLNIYSTEMIITSMRVLVKIGISTATTAEIDRTRISSVIVTKPLIGRLFDYGWITVLGYSGNITGLPVLAHPHEIQKHIYNKQHSNL